ncbi:NAD-dependent epimerase/dehydratase family protein [Rhodopila sp.]|uniref:NAD-dependent epimerase/dehydratase family protein n=1 Tax=Rhodopila sp. TaxID=2480087 RepID=UPI003D138604
MPDSVDFSRKLVLVLGASGYIGSRVVAALSGSPIYRPVAASRRSDPGVDATKPDNVRKALRGVDYVVNCIAGSNQAMLRTTEVLCEAARASPPMRIIHLSSMAVYGAATGTVREDSAPVPPMSGYGQAKIDCERIVLGYVRDGGDAVVLRPSCVFGPASPQWTTRLARLLRAGRIGDLGSAGDGCCNLACIDDVVAAVMAALNAPDIVGSVFNVSSSVDLTWNEFLTAFAKALGATPVQRIAPRTLRMETKLLAPVRRIAGMALRSPMTEAITPSLAALWSQDIRIDCSRAQASLRLPRTPLERMIASAVQHERGLTQAMLS